MISYRILILFTLMTFLVQTLAKNTAQNFKLRGPGLSPGEIILPCRYFFVENVDGTDKNVDSDSRINTLNVTIAGKDRNGRICRAWTEVFLRPNGSFIIRYKLFSPCFEVLLTVLQEGHHVTGSPLQLGQVMPDSCPCPTEAGLETWILTAWCPAPTRQLEADLAKFSSPLDMGEEVKRAREIFRHAGSQCWCHYAVKNGDVFRECYGQHVGFNMFWDNVLRWLARRAILPDLEMMVNLGDWPLVKTATSPPLPMFSWCGSSSTQDIVVPTYELTEASLECMGRQALDILSSMGKNKVPWEDKTEKLFWRGRDSRKERLNLVEIASQYPDLINASITAFFFFREEEARLGRSSYVSFFDFFNFKYQLNIDGTVAAYRLPYLLAGSGVVFKQQSDYYEHFYSELEPMVHYIPVRSDLSDLVEKIQWARENDETVRKISRQGQQFAEDHLLPHNVVCYHAQLLVRWAKLMKFPIKITEGMEKVDLEEFKENKKYQPCYCDEFKSILRKSDQRADKEEL